MITPEAVWNQLRTLEDKMFGTPLSVVDVGLIYDVEVRDRDVYIKVAVFNKGHLQINSLSSPVRQQILAMEGVGEVRVECVWEPAWTPDRLSQKARDVLGFEPDDPIEGRLLTPLALNMERTQGMVKTPVAAGQSLQLVWPHIVAMVAMIASMLAVSYIRFMREEIRA